MKSIFLINVHSFSDIITNSSTDIFACKTDKSEEAVKELMEKLVGVGIEGEGGINDVLTVETWTVEKFYNYVGDYGHQELSRWDGEKLVPLKSDEKVIVIMGVDDNSIPYWLIQYIEYELEGYQVHLG